MESAAASIGELASGADAALGAVVADLAGSVAIAMADEARREAASATRFPEGSLREGKLREVLPRFDAARDQLTAAIRSIEREVDRLKSAAADSDDGRTRVKLKSRLAQARLVSSRLLYEKAQALPADASEGQRLRREASQELAQLYEKSSKWVVGLYAHLYEGRCYAELGETALAAACFEDLTSQPATDAELRKLSTLAHADLAALWINEGKPERSLEKPGEWLARLPVVERRSAEGGGCSTGSAWPRSRRQSRSASATPSAVACSRERATCWPIRPACRATPRRTHGVSGPAR